MNSSSFARLLAGCLIGAALTLVLTLLGAAFGSADQAFANSNSPDTLRAAPPNQGPPPTLSPFGVSDTKALNLASNQTAATLALEAGVVWERTSVSWDVIEPSKNQMHWGTFDTHINNLTNKGFKAYVLILNNPGWAATTPCGPVRESELDEFAQFVHDLAERYDGDPMPEVLLWGLYNEPDNQVYSTRGENWGGCFGENDIDGNGRKDYKDYAIMARIAWEAIHQGNPNAKLVIGNVAFDNFTAASAPEDYPPSKTNNCCFNYKFIDQLFTYMKKNELDEGKKYGDYFAFNNYWIYNDAYWNELSSERGPAAKAAVIEQKMEDKGLSFPLLISEMGAPDVNPPDDKKELKLQAQRLVQMYAQALSAKVQVIIWWPFADIPPEHWEGGLYKGIVTADLEPKPSYKAMKVLTGQLGGCKYKGKLNGISGVEGYTFNCSGGKTTVLWATGGTVTVPFSAHELSVVKMQGKSKTHTSTTGTINVQVGANPVYVTILQE